MQAALWRSLDADYSGYSKRRRKMRPESLGISCSLISSLNSFGIGKTSANDLAELARCAVVDTGETIHEGLKFLASLGGTPLSEEAI